MPKPKPPKRGASSQRAASPPATTRSAKPSKPATSSGKRARSKPAPAKPRTKAARPAAAKLAKPAAAKLAKPTAAKRTAAKPVKRAAAKPVKRVDFGAPIAGFFAKQPAVLRPLLEELRDLVQETAPDASSSIKWGMPFFTIGETMMCALGGHKSHVNLILSGPPGTYADPEGRLAGDGKTGRHLKLTASDQVPRDAVRGWLRTAATLARKP